LVLAEQQKHHQGRVMTAAPHLLLALTQLAAVAAVLYQITGVLVALVVVAVQTLAVRCTLLALAMRVVIHP
jgi:hypothetical protein